MTVLYSDQIVSKDKLILSNENHASRAILCYIAWQTSEETLHISNKTQ